MPKLPADIYDALELSALAYGGIGTGWFDEPSNEPGSEPIPLCVIGHLSFIIDDRTKKRNLYYSVYERFRAALGASEISGETIAVMNDNAVQTVNLRNSRPLFSRITFEEWCAELGITRGD